MASVAGRLSPARGNASMGAGPRSGPGGAGVEDDLKDMKARYRTAARSHREAVADTQKLIAQQREAIASLKLENKELRARTATDNRSRLAAPTTSQHQRLAKLKELADTYQRKMEVERRKLEELRISIDLCQAKAHEAAKGLGGHRAAATNANAVFKHSTMLENRLQQALQRFNAMLAENKSLRADIQQRHRERAALEVVLGRACKELATAKKDISAVIEATNMAYEARDQALAEVAAIQTRNDKEHTAYEAELAAAQKLLEADQQLHSINAKSLRLKEPPVTLRGSDAGFSVETTSTVASEEELDVDAFEAALRQVQRLSGVSGTAPLLELFAEAEDTNFLTFKHVNDMNADIKRAQERVADLSAQAEAAEAESATTDPKTKEVVSDLDTRVELLNQKRLAYDEKYADDIALLKRLRDRVESMYEKVGCKPEEARKVVGVQGVNLQTIGTYLGIIEQHALTVAAHYGEKMGLPSLAPSQLPDSFGQADGLAFAVPPSSTGTPSRLGSASGRPGSAISINAPSTTDPVRRSRPGSSAHMRKSAPRVVYDPATRGGQGHESDEEEVPLTSADIRKSMGAKAMGGEDQSSTG